MSEAQSSAHVMRAQGSGVRNRMQVAIRVSPVEFDILEALADGLQTRDIALRQNRSIASVEGYIRVLCGKLDARTRTHLVAQAFRAGILTDNTGRGA